MALQFGVYIILFTWPSTRIWGFPFFGSVRSCGFSDRVTLTSSRFVLGEEEELCRPCSCRHRVFTSATGLCCGPALHIPVAVVEVPLFLLFLCFVFYYFYCTFIHVLFTALYLLRSSYVDIWQDEWLGFQGDCSSHLYPGHCRLLAGCHDSLFLRIPDDRHSVAWPCLPHSWFLEAP